MPISSEGIILKQMPQKNFTEKILRTQQKNHKTYKEDWYNNKKRTLPKNSQTAESIRPAKFQISK